MITKYSNNKQTRHVGLDNRKNYRNFDVGLKKVVGIYIESLNALSLNII